MPVVEAVTTLATGAAAFSVSRTGTLVYVPGGNDSAAQRSLVWVTRDGREEPIAAAYALPRLSPDGRWLAFQSQASGRDEIFVRPFPNMDGGNWTISPSGGTRPLWARNGTELFYLDSAGAMTRVPVQTAPTFSAGTATTLFKTRYVVPGVVVGRGYDVSPDGQRFLMIKQAGTAQAPTMVVVLNWLEELKAKLPTK